MTDTFRLTGPGAPMPPRQRTSEGGAGTRPRSGMKVARGTGRSSRRDRSGCGWIGDDVSELAEARSAGTELSMPKLGMAMTEGVFVQWLADDGEQISEGQPIYVVGTDKVDSEIPAPSPESSGTSPLRMRRCSRRPARLDRSASMVAGIAGRAAADPAGWALTDGVESLTWADLNGALNCAVNAVLRADLGPDRRVAIMAQNSVEAAIAHLAVIYAGASAVPVNWQLRPAEASHILRDSAARLVLASPQSAPVARQACAPGTVIVDSLAEFAATAPPDEPAASLPPRRALMYTSGTSGVPKAVEQPLPMFAGGATIGEHVANIAASPAALLGPHLAAGPLHHTGPLNGLRCLAAGTPTVVLPRFDAAAALVAIQQYRIASSTMVPTHFARCWRCLRRLGRVTMSAACAAWRIPGRRARSASSAR